MPSIGSLNEKPLHAALKARYQQPGDQTEVPLNGYVIDIVRDDLLIEIQTRNFSAIKAKLFALTKQYRVRLIHPIAQRKWLVKLPTGDNEATHRRKSPKHGTLFHLFEELVSFPELLLHSNFSLQVVLIEEEELRRHDSSRRGWRRKGWVTHERRLLRVIEERIFESPQDLESLLPANLPTMFTTADLSQLLKTSRRIAQKMTYCLQRMHLFARVAKRGNAIVYQRAK